MLKNAVLSINEYTFERIPHAQRCIHCDMLMHEYDMQVYTSWGLLTMHVACPSDVHGEHMWIAPSVRRTVWRGISHTTLIPTFLY